MAGETAAQHLPAARGWQEQRLQTEGGPRPSWRAQGWQGTLRMDQSPSL